MNGLRPKNVCKKIVYSVSVIPLQVCQFQIKMGLSGARICTFFGQRRAFVKIFNDYKILTLKADVSALS